MNSKIGYDERFLKDIVGVDFFDIEDLFTNRKLIRKNFQYLSYDYKRVYKWYFYFKLCLIKNPLKDLMWSYIAESETFENELILEYLSFVNKKRAIIEKQRYEDAKID